MTPAVRAYLAFIVTVIAGMGGAWLVIDGGPRWLVVPVAFDGFLAGVFAAALGELQPRRKPRRDEAPTIH